MPVLSVKRRTTRMILVSMWMLMVATWMLMAATWMMMMRRMKVVVVWGPMGSVAASCGADVAGPVLLTLLLWKLVGRWGE